MWRFGSGERLELGIARVHELYDKRNSEVSGSEWDTGHDGGKVAVYGTVPAKLRVASVGAESYGSDVADNFDSDCCNFYPNYSVDSA